MFISFVMPAYNESEGIESNVKRVWAYAKSNFEEFEVIVVDDGSSDGTLDVLRKIHLDGLAVLSNGKNMGPGAAFRKGLQASSGDVVITLDSDLSYPVEDTSRLLEKLNNGYDMVIGSPFLENESMKVPFLRIALSKLGSLIYSIFLHQGLSTYTSFFRAYKKKLVKEVEFESDGFESQVEIIWRARKKGFKITEIASKYQGDPSRVSKFKVTKELGRHLKFLLFKVIPGK